MVNRLKGRRPGHSQKASLARQFHDDLFGDTFGEKRGFAAIGQAPERQHRDRGAGRCGTRLGLYGGRRDDARRAR